MNWTEKSELRCKAIGDKAGAYVWMSNAAAEKYMFYEDVIGIATVVFTFLLGGSGIPALAATADVHTIQIVNGVVQGLVFLSGFFMAIIQYYNIPGTREQYRWCAASYSALFIDIQKTLQHTPDKRAEFSFYYAHIQEKHFELIGKTPEMPPDIVQKYYRKLGNAAICEDILFNDIDTIDVYVDSERDITASVMPEHQSIKDSLKTARSKRIEALDKSKPMSSPRKKFELERYTVGVL